MAVVNPLRKFNLDFCRKFTPAKLRLIYKTESPELIEQLIEAVHGKQESETPKEETKELTPKKKAKK